MSLEIIQNPGLLLAGMLEVGGSLMLIQSSSTHYSADGTRVKYPAISPRIEVNSPHSDIPDLVYCFKGGNADTKPNGSTRWTATGLVAVKIAQKIMPFSPAREKPIQDFIKWCLASSAQEQFDIFQNSDHLTKNVLSSSEKERYYPLILQPLFLKGIVMNRKSCHTEEDRRTIGTWNRPLLEVICDQYGGSLYPKEPKPGESSKLALSLESTRMFNAVIESY